MIAIKQQTAVPEPILSQGYFQCATNDGLFVVFFDGMAMLSIAAQQGLNNENISLNIECLQLCQRLGQPDHGKIDQPDSQIISSIPKYVQGGRNRSSHSNKIDHTTVGERRSQSQ